MRARADGRGQVFRSTAAAVAVDVSVREGGRPVSGLGKGDFELRDNGVLQTILDASVENLPLDVSLTIALSGFPLEPVQQAWHRSIAAVPRALGPDDRLAVWVITRVLARTVTERLSLGPPPAEIALLPADTAANFGKPFFDAVVLALVAEPLLGRRQLAVLLTDGKVDSSFFDGPALLDAARYAETRLFVLAAPGSSRGGPEYSPPRWETLRDVAEVTGGRLFRLDGDGALRPAFADALDECRTSYVLHYIPMGVGRAGWHELSVAVKTRGRYDVRARKGYWRG